MFKSGFKLGAALLLGAAFIASPAFAEEAPVFKLNVGGVDGPGGSIKGIVKFNGDQKPRKAIQVAADAACEAAHKDKPPLAETFVFGDNGTLQNVFVYVSKGAEGKTGKPISTPELDQHGCIYIPHVQGMMKGQELKIKNSDNTTHNVNSTGAKANTGFNIATGPGVVETRKFTKPEVGMPFKCDIHPWMSAYVHVVDNPYYAVTQQDGTFEIKGLPAGTYEITVWHELAAFKPDKEKIEVKVEDGKASEVTVTYAPPAPKAK